MFMGFRATRSSDKAIGNSEIPILQDDAQWCEGRLRSPMNTIEIDLYLYSIVVL